LVNRFNIGAEYYKSGGHAEGKVLIEIPIADTLLASIETS
jgi:hypothetical protein